jgi:hypothetical protein
MSHAAETATAVPLGRRVRRYLADRPLIPLIVLLIALVIVLQILRPGIVNERWSANTVKFAIPLAILAGCQTLTMLTGGIDLSVGTIASLERRERRVDRVLAHGRPGAGPARRRDGGHGQLRHADGADDAPQHPGRHQGERLAQALRAHALGRRRRQ